MTTPALVIHDSPHYLLTGDPTVTESLADYERRGGYQALERLMEQGDPRAVIRELEIAGLRGRGGANFPTHHKWEMVRDAAPGERYVICNGGEHEPGSRKDRELLTRHPHSVLEGLMIAAHTVGASTAYVYLTEDQHEALESIQGAVGELLSARSGPVRISIPPCDITCFSGPATYVSGEETAAISAIEGREAKPRRKPPYPTVAGLFSAPTLVNNAETLAHIPVILRQGATWFQHIGTPGSRGTLLITLSNGVNRPGVYEVPYGTTIRTIIDGCGGGTIDGKAVKAILPGGPSLPFVPVGEALDAPFDHETMKQLGSGVGCGAIRIWLEGECMVEPILEISKFFAEAQCGQCPPCRMETHTFADNLLQLANGSGSGKHLAQMEKIAAYAIAKGGLCNLIPMAAAAPLSGLRLFEADFRSHIEHKGCGGALAPGHV